MEASDSAVKAFNYSHNWDPKLQMHTKLSTLNVKLSDMQMKRLEDAERNEGQKSRGAQQSPGDLLFYAGYVAPVQITSYVCGECEKTYEGPPPNHEVFIELDDEHMKFSYSDITRIGHFYYMCEHDHLVSGQTSVFSGDKPDIKHIRKDLSGEFIPITPQTIENYLTQSQKNAEEGKLPFQEMNTAQKLAKKINYKIEEERIKSVENSYRNSLRNNYVADLESNLGILSREIDIYGDNDYWNDGEGPRYLQDFFTHIPTVDKLPNEDSKEMVRYILSILKERDQESLERKRETVKAFEKRINEIETLEKKLLSE